MKMQEQHWLTCKLECDMVTLFGLHAERYWDHQYRRYSSSYVFLPAFPGNFIQTIPAWARDEPQSANDSVCQLGNSHQFDPNASVSSLSGSYPTESSRWWAFIHPLRHGHPPPRLSKLEKPQRRALSFRDRSMSWLSSSHHHRSHEANGFSHHRRDSLSARPHDWNIQASSSTPSIPFAHTQTSGWDIPWSPGVPQRSGNQMDSSVPTRDVNSENYNRDHPWETRKRQLRTFILTNNYVPLVSILRCFLHQLI